MQRCKQGQLVDLLTAETLARLNRNNSSAKDVLLSMMSSFQTVLHTYTLHFLFSICAFVWLVQSGRGSVQQRVPHTPIRCIPCFGSQNKAIRSTQDVFHDCLQASYDVTASCSHAQLRLNKNNNENKQTQVIWIQAVRDVDTFTSGSRSNQINVYLRFHQLWGFSCFSSWSSTVSSLTDVHRTWAPVSLWM